MLAGRRAGRALPLGAKVVLGRSEIALRGSKAALGGSQIALGRRKIALDDYKKGFAGCVQDL